MVGVPAKQIGWVSKAGNTLKFDKAGIATDSFDNSTYKIENDNLILINFIDLQAQYQAYKQEIHDVLNTSSYIMGSKIVELEENLLVVSIQ